MIFELVLALTLETAACSDPAPLSMTSATLPIMVVKSEVTRFPNRVGEPVLVSSRPYTCATYLETTYTKLAKYPTYQACMERVAAIGEPEHVRAYCVKKEDI